ncbi:hypothetical protein MMC06_001054 [Schaereria dolodes]|nr:hypothetical protein [Schaereria dolodes]
MTRLLTGDNTLTDGFNCSSLDSNPQTNWYINSTVASEPQGSTSITVNARDSCKEAAEVVCRELTSPTKNIWMSETFGNCWVGVFVPSTAVNLPSAERCMTEILGPMINTCVNQTKVENPANGQYYQPYDEASLNVIPNNTVLRGGWEYDSNWPSYSVMTLAESRILTASFPVLPAGAQTVENVAQSLNSLGALHGGG